MMRKLLVLTAGLLLTLSAPTRPAPFPAAVATTPPPTAPLPAAVATTRPPAPVTPADLALTPAWSTELEGAGTSSPRCADLNGDGHLDVVVGAGKEFKLGSLAALDGRDGSLLWKQDFPDEVYATPCLVTITDDDVPDVVVGRRKTRGDLSAHDGATGRRLWSLRDANPERVFPPTHFNTAQVCPDLDDDGLDDLVLLQGGGEDSARRPGEMYLVSAADGTLLRRFPTPDGKEAYMVPCLERRADGLRMLMGTGGETVPGNIFSLDFPALEVQWSQPSRGKKGFVGGSVLVDLDDDGATDVITTGFHGAVYRLDGDSGEERWRHRHRGFETYVTPAVGRFAGDDEVLDVVAAFSEGRWPDYKTRTVMQWIDGASGEVLHERDYGVMNMSSPLVADLDGDGLDEVVIQTNMSFQLVRHEVVSRLGIFDGRPGHALLVDAPFQGFNAATPWLGDMDGDGDLELVVIHQNHVTRQDLRHPEGAAVRWNQYRGPHDDGVLRR